MKKTDSEIPDRERKWSLFYDSEKDDLSVFENLERGKRVLVISYHPLANNPSITEGKYDHIGEMVFRWEESEHLDKKTNTTVKTYKETKGPMLCLSDSVITLRPPEGKVEVYIHA